MKKKDRHTANAAAAIPDVCGGRVDAVDCGARLDVEVTRDAVDHDEARQLAAGVVLLQAAEPAQERE